MKVCVPIGPGGVVGQRWGKADRVAVADITSGAISSWEEFDVGWDVLHDQGTEGSHHARVVKFLRDNRVEVVAAPHVGPGMVRMLDTMGVRLVTGAAGDARTAAVAAAAGQHTP